MQRHTRNLTLRLYLLGTIGLALIFLAVRLWGDNGYVQNVVSGIALIFIVIGASWLVHNLTERAALLAFFNVKQSKQVVVYLSNLGVVPGGARGQDNLPRSFQGPAIPDYEAELIRQF